MVEQALNLLTIALTREIFRNIYFSMAWHVGPIGYHPEEDVRLEGWLCIRSTCHAEKRDLRSLPSLLIHPRDTMTQ